MLRKLNRILAVILAFALVVTTFGSNFANMRVYAVEDADQIVSLDNGNEDAGEPTWSDMTEEITQEEETPVTEEYVEEETVEETDADAPAEDENPENLEEGEDGENPDEDPEKRHVLR